MKNWIKIENDLPTEGKIVNVKSDKNGIESFGYMLNGCWHTEKMGLTTRS